MKRTGDDTREALRNLAKGIQGLADAKEIYRSSLEAIYGRLLAISERLERIENRLSTLELVRETDALVPSWPFTAVDLETMLGKKEHAR